MCFDELLPYKRTIDCFISKIPKQVFLKVDIELFNTFEFILNSSSNKYPPLKWQLMVILLLEGASVMFVELSAAKMLAPYYGGSLIVWASILGGTMFSLAIGYLLGGHISDRSSNLNSSLSFVILAAALAISLVPFWSQTTMFRFARLDYFIQIPILAIFLLAPPLILLGMVPQLCIKILSTDEEKSGKMAGFTYGTSTIGGIIGTLLFGFYIIPSFGMTMPLLVTGFIFSIIPIYQIMKASRYGVFIFYVLFLSLLTYRYSTISSVNSSIKVQHYSEGLLGQIMVADFPSPNVSSDTNRLLMINRIPESIMNLGTNENSSMEYISLVMKIIQPVSNKSEVLLIGMGAGNLIKKLQEKHFHLDVCELDQRIADAAFNYFDLNDNFNLKIDDARHYLRTCQKQYDLIILDVFKGENPPSHLLTLESINHLKNLLAENGIVLINFNGFLTGNIGKGGRSVLKTLMKSSFKVKLAALPRPEANRNSVFILSTLDREYPVKDYLIEINSIDTTDAYLLTDDLTILEHLNMQAARNWRENYHRYYTHTFIQEGIPMFQ